MHGSLLAHKASDLFLRGGNPGIMLQILPGMVEESTLHPPWLEVKLVKATWEGGRNHPKRSCLTSGRTQDTDRQMEERRDRQWLALHKAKWRQEERWVEGGTKNPPTSSQSFRLASKTPWAISSARTLSR